MSQYDPNVIYKYATHLYSRAHTLVLVHTLIGVLIGGFIGKVYSTYAEVTASPSSAALSAFGFG
jgi:hypothetical protein